MTTPDPPRPVLSDERAKYWRNATDEEHGDALLECLLSVDATAYELKKEPLPQFPQPTDKSA